MFTSCRFVVLCVLAESVLGQRTLPRFAKHGDPVSKINTSEIAQPITTFSIDESASDMEELAKHTTVQSEQKEHDIITEAMVLLSFMFLRSMVALRSLDSVCGTNEMLWSGIAFAVVTRCVAEGIVSTACELPPLGSIIAIATREAFHMYGLRLVLDNFLVSEC